MKLIGLLLFIFAVIHIHNGAQQVALEIKVSQACIESAKTRYEVLACP